MFEVSLFKSDERDEMRNILKGKMLVLPFHKYTKVKNDFCPFVFFCSVPSCSFDTMRREQFEVG